VSFMSVAVMPSAVRMSYTISSGGTTTTTNTNTTNESTTAHSSASHPPRRTSKGSRASRSRLYVNHHPNYKQLDIEHDQSSVRTTSTSQSLREEIDNEVSTKNDTTVAKSEKNHIKVGSSMILNMQNAYPLSRTTCCDLLVKGYLRMYHGALFDTLPIDILPLFIEYTDPLLKWCLLHQEPKVLLMHKNEYHLYLNKNDWKTISASTKYIIHDIMIDHDCDTEQDGEFKLYTITIQNDSHFGSNLNDIQWLCQIMSTNIHLNKLRISNCKNLLEFNKFHFLLQNSLLKSLNDDISYQHLHEICIDSYKHFNDECFKILLDVIDKKCPALTHLHLWRTDISNQSVKQLIAFLNKAENTAHPLWSIDIEFCPKINDDALQLICTYLRQNPLKRIYIKCTGKSLFPDQLFQDQRLSVSIYPT